MASMIAPSREVDVVVAGYGAAGGTAALTAHDAGAEVLILEKLDQPGGNSLVSSAMMIFPTDPSQAPRLAEYLHRVTCETTDRSLIDTFVEGLMKNPEWFESLGGELETYDYTKVDPTISYYIPNKTFYAIPPMDLTLELRHLKQTARCPQPTGGARVWHLLDGHIRKRGIPVWTGTPVLDAVRDRDGEVTGVMALRNKRRVFILQTYDFSRIPAYLIMDGENARGKPLGMNIFSYNVVVKGYQWSADNSKEIAAGWIKVARSVAELARLIGTPEDAIRETLMRYNSHCLAGVDLDFGRPIETLKPIEPPYYVMVLHPLMYNTQGGSRR